MQAHLATGTGDDEARERQRQEGRLQGPAIHDPGADHALGAVTMARVIRAPREGVDPGQQELLGQFVVQHAASTLDVVGDPLQQVDEAERTRVDDPG